MNLGEWTQILIGQAVVTIIVAVVLYRMLRKKLKVQEEKTGHLDRVQKKVKRQLDKHTRDLDKRTRRLLTQVSDMQATSWQIDSRVAAMKATSDMDAASPVHDSRRVRIVVNTLPKVGSSSIIATLQSGLPNATIDHLHAVSLEGQIALARDIDATPEGSVRSSMVWWLNRTMVVRPELERLRSEIAPNDGVFFVCGTREPLGWALSMVFQLIDLNALPAESAQVANAQRIVMDWFAEKPGWHWTPAPTAWVQREIVGYLGVNPMETGFDQERGYQVMQTKRGRLLLVRQENLGSLPQALAELLGAPASMFKTERKNVGGEKGTGSLYKEVAAKLRFPRSFVESVYSDPYSTTFYSPQEREKYAARWTE
jgi:hypothetical protein